jgi:hypothetical protein
MREIISDQRQLFRNRVCYGGLIAFNDRQSTLACIVRNFTAFGARIEFENPALLPDEIDFAVPRRSRSCLAHLAWGDRNAAGLVFHAARSANRETGDVISLEWMRRLRSSERINKQLQARIDQLRSEH